MPFRIFDCKYLANVRNNEAVIHPFDAFCRCNQSWTNNTATCQIKCTVDNISTNKIFTLGSFSLLQQATFYLGNGSDLTGTAWHFRRHWKSLVDTTTLWVKVSLWGFRNVEKKYNSNSLFLIHFESHTPKKCLFGEAMTQILHIKNQFRRQNLSIIKKKTHKKEE